MIKSRKTKNRLFRRIGLASGLGALAALANTSLAQDSTDATVERVVVTGSSIPTAAEVTAAPLDVVDQAAIQRTGTQDVLQTLQRSNPTFSGNGNLGQTNANIASGSTLGGSQIALRNLPTLVLLNGRRVADASAAAAGGFAFSDVNLFPVSLVKRIEVLKDGASAIYGSDAIGGVVNVILDQDFTGVEIGSHYGFAEKGDITEQRYNILVGFGDAKTHLVFGAQYFESDPIYSRTRDFAKPYFATTTYAGTARGSNGGYYFLNPALNSPSQNNPTPSTTGTIPTAGNILPGGVSVNGAGTGTGLAAGTYLTTDLNGLLTGFDLANATTITLDQNRKSYYTSFDRELFDKYVHVFGDFLYSDNYSQSQLNAQPLSNATGIVIPASAPYNPFGRTIDSSTLSGNDRLQINNRFTFAPRVFRNDTDFYRFVGGFKGEIVKNYTYETAATYSKDSTRFRNFNLINGDNLNPAIAGGYDAAGNPVTGGAFSLVNGNIQPALDFFSRNPSSASLQGVLATDVRDLETSQFIYDARVTAFPFELPAGPLGISGGFEFRYESLKATIDPQQIFLGSVPVADIDASRDIHSFYAEVDVPIVSPAMKIPGVYTFDINGAVRYDDYSDAGASTIPKASFRYQPTEDVTFRGTFTKSFIAPTLYQTQGPSSSGFTPSGITLNGNAQDQAQLQSGSNPNLSPSEAETYSAGIVLSPHWVKGLTLSADYFNIYQRDIVGTVGAQKILSDVEARGPASPFAGQVHFNSFSGPGVTAPGQLDGNLASVFVIDTNINLGAQKLQGFDFGANYGADLKSFGFANVGVNGTYYIKYDLQTLPGEQFFSTEGRFSSNNGDLPQYRLVPYVEYKYGGATLSALGNYIPGLHDAGGVDLTTYKRSNDGRLPKIRDYYTIDLLASYEFGLGKPDAPEPAPVPSPKDGKDGKDFKSTTAGKNVAETMVTKKWYDGIRLAAGIRNVTNARPPFIANQNDNTDTSTYDPYQRFYYFELSKKF